MDPVEALSAPAATVREPDPAVAVPPEPVELGAVAVPAPAATETAALGVAVTTAAVGPLGPHTAATAVSVTTHSGKQDLAVAVSAAAEAVGRRIQAVVPVEASERPERSTLLRVCHRAPMVRSN